MHTCMPGLAVQNYATYPSMPAALPSIMRLCPVGRGVITGIRPYARYQPRSASTAPSCVGAGDGAGDVMQACAAYRQARNTQFSMWAGDPRNRPMVDGGCASARCRGRARNGQAVSQGKHLTNPADPRGAGQKSRQPSQRCDQNYK